ncbi:MAG: GH36-type glycosyl hydrolase domain-containing protein, partial [Planctomycetota bacterium]
MNFRTSNVLLFLCLAGLTMLLSCAAQNTSRSAGHSLATGSGRSADDLADKILNNPDLPFVLEKARSILKKGLTAGSGYGEVWIRDLNTFIEIALEVQDKAELRRALLVFFHFQGEDGNIIDGYIPAEKANVARRALLVFFHFQGEDGNIIDGYIPAEKANVAYKYIRSETMPNLLGHKNTVETDQESSLVQAICKYVKKTGDDSILSEQINGLSVRQRLAMALNYLLNHRYSEKYGLIWGATTVDWGDVQPEHSWGVELDASSHRAIDIYDNAMFVIAVENYMSLAASEISDRRKWKSVADKIRANTRKHLWDRDLHKFRPHIYLEGSPFPEYFDEHRIYYHGGTAIAIEAGILSKPEILDVLNDMVNNKEFAGAASIGLTVYPPYPAGFFKNKSMRPFSYQNGGDWT